MNAQDWQEILHRKWIVHGEKNFESELHKTFKKFLSGRPKNEEAKRWLEAIPCDFWLQTRNNALHLVASEGSTELLRYLLADGYDELNRENSRGNTPLLVAIERGNDEMARLLLSSGATHGNKNCERGYGPLHLAAELENFEIVKSLVDAGADVNAHDHDLASPLHVLLRHQRPEESVALRLIAVVLIRSGAQFDRVNALGESPLHLAISNRYLETASILLDMGASAGTVDRHLTTPLHLTVRQRLETLTRRLLVEKRVDVDAIDALGMSPLCYAFKTHSVILAKLLLEYGACTDIFYVDNFDPVYEVINSGDFQLVELLLSLKPDSRDFLEFECLRVATGCKKIEMLEKLIANGADVTAKDSTGFGVIFYAANTTSVDMTTRERADLLRFLITRGAAVNLKQLEIEETMYLLVAYGDLRTVRLFSELQRKFSEYPPEKLSKLLSYARENLRDRGVLKYILREGRVDPNQLDRSGYALIHRMANEGNVAGVSCLVKMGAEVDRRSGEARRTALHLAVDRRRLECVRLLLKLGADVDAEDAQGYTPLSLAVESHDAESARCIVVRVALVRFLKGDSIGRSNAETIDSREELREYLDECRSELERLRERKIPGSDALSLLDALVNPGSYARDADVVTALADDRLLGCFPIYRDLLIDGFERARKRPRLLESVEPVLARLLARRSDGTDRPILDNILRHLRNKDLRNFAAAFADT